MRELGDGPIAAKRGTTRACKREEKADLQRPNNVSRTDDRGPASSRATEIRPSSAREHKHRLGHRPSPTSSCARPGRSYDRPVRRASSHNSSTPARQIESRNRGGEFRHPLGLRTRESPLRNRSRRKASRTLASLISFKKVRSIPRSGVYSCFTVAFLEQQLGNLSRNSLGAGGSSGDFNLSIRRAGKVQF
jgi:hypothetical protein